ncbi:MAG TPA: 16S rRNA (adenine(1518)-N(6)/adenine(1519)-N(6))-dimethyltransferase RsmA [Armatimonadota bacterium]|jgi:16S rRNA (adenine1518-N6/adenine1519-N6)-dimethyltransferase
MSTLTDTPQQVRDLPLPARNEYLLRRFDLAPRKSLGQNFLINEGATERISEAAAAPGEPLLEIGGGLGALTVPLSRTGLPLTVVEFDAGAGAALAWLLGDLPHVRLIQQDFMRLDLAETMPHPCTAAGNLPYQAGTAILQKLWAPGSPCRLIVAMVQKEVADRLRTGPGSKAYGPLSLLAALHVEEIRVVSQLGPESFSPPPKVNSTVLSMRRREGFPEGVQNYDSMLAAIRGAFGSRRKTLANSLRLTLGLTPEQVVTVLRRARLDGRRRGETLTLAEFIQLGNSLYALGAD